MPAADMLARKVRTKAARVAAAASASSSSAAAAASTSAAAVSAEPSSEEQATGAASAETTVTEQPEDDATPAENYIVSVLKRQRLHDAGFLQLADNARAIFSLTMHEQLQRLTAHIFNPSTLLKVGHLVHLSQRTPFCALTESPPQHSALRALCDQHQGSAPVRPVLMLGLLDVTSLPLILALSPCASCSWTASCRCVVCSMPFVSYPATGGSRVWSVTLFVIC